MRRWMIGIAVGVMALGIGAGSGAGGSDARKGGIFRISLAIGSGIDSLDPALEYTAPGWLLLDTTCARLMTYPDKPEREAFRLVPEVATGFPKRSRDLRTYTFTLRKGFRFSDGQARSRDRLRPRDQPRARAGGVLALGIPAPRCRRRRRRPCG